MTRLCDDPRINEGIRLFNEGEYFACHDVFEDLWSEITGPERSFIQGLIHAAVSLFHFEGGNLTGARKMFGTFRAYTGSFIPSYCGIDVAALHRDMEYCFEELLAVKSGYPSQVQLHPDRVPRIQHSRSLPPEC